MDARRVGIILSFLLLLFLVSCNLPSQEDGTASKENRVLTAAAQTVAAIGTATVQGTAVTNRATATPAPTHTAGVTATASPTVAPTSSEPCIRASYEGDATIPDGSVLPPNSPFTKTWLIKNTGSCAWTKDYSIIFANRGVAMSERASFSLITDGEVKPGETARVSVQLRAPGETGEYRGYWRLRSDQGQEFGTGPSGGADFYVQIQVADEFSFARLACSAEWSTGAGVIPCPGKEGDNQGYVLLAENQAMEDGKEREGPAILVIAQPIANGYIKGEFPPVVVPTQADFRATLSCAPGANGCYVRFRVTYRVDNGEEQLLGEWSEGYEGGVNEAVKDLNMVAGKETAFTLYVYGLGDPSESKAVWFNPRIVK